MKSRLIRPQLFLDERLVNVDPDSRFFLVGMLFLADREGRLEDRPLKLRAQILPYGSGDGSPHLGALEQAGIISRGEGYIQIEGFSEWVSPFRTEPQSVIPENFERSTLVEHGSYIVATGSDIVATVKERREKREVKREKKENTEESMLENLSLLDAVWLAYPRRPNSTKGNKAIALPRIRAVMKTYRLDTQQLLEIVSIYSQHPNVAGGYVQAVEVFFGDNGRFLECYSIWRKEHGNQ